MKVGCFGRAELTGGFEGIICSVWCAFGLLPPTHTATEEDEEEEEYEEEEYEEEEEEEEMEEYSRGRGGQQQKRRGAGNDWHYADRRRRMRARKSNAMGISGLVKGAAKVRGLVEERSGRVWGYVCSTRHPPPTHKVIYRLRTHTTHRS